MKTVSALLLILLSSVSTFVFAEQDTSPALRIDLVEDRRFQSARPPRELGLAVDVTVSCFYKLLFNDFVVKAGLMSAGTNFINFEAGHLYDSPGISVYFLELKLDDRTFRHRLELDVQMESDRASAPVIARKAGPDLKDAVYELSLYIDDQLVSANRQTHFQKFPMKFSPPPMPKFKYSDPTKNFELDPFANSFSFFHAAALAAELVKEIRKRTTHEKKSYNYLRKKLILADFSWVTSTGSERKQRLILRLSVDDEIEPAPLS